jgi:hypothetical protein
MRSRLRVTLNDPLFTEGHRMCPSVYATQLAPAIAAALKSLNQERRNLRLTLPAVPIAFRLRLRISPLLYLSGLNESVAGDGARTAF